VLKELSQTYLLEHAKEKIQSCVEKGFEFLDESAKVSVFWHLENDFQISKDLIIEKPEEFVRALHHIFGDGAVLLEKKIAKEICGSFAIYFDEVDLDFSRIVKLAKKKAQSWEQETRNWKL
jgi:hypothetical protein